MKSLSSLMIVGLLLAASPLFAGTVNVEPGQSLQKAADGLRPGDTLLLADGTYHQSFKLTKSGTADKPITIKAKTPGKVIITGAMKTTPKFEKVEGAIYKTKWVPAKKWSGSGTRQLWVVADDRNLYNYTSMEEMKTCRSGKNATPLEGFFYQDGEMYVRLLGSADPNKAKVAISRPDTTVLLDIQGQQHIVLEGLRFHVAPAAAVRLGGRNHPHAICKHIVIRDCSFFGFHQGVAGVAIRQGKKEFGPTDVTIEHCQFSNYPTYQWMRNGELQSTKTWRPMYGSNLGGNAIGPGGGSVSRWKIRHCYIHDCFDGIGVASTGVKDPTLNNEYSYNLLQNNADDAIEFDTMVYAGVHAHHNVILDGLCLLGLSPVQKGGVTIENNIVYVSPEYGLPWCVLFKFSTPGGSAWTSGGFRPLTGMTIRNNTLINTKCGVSWGASPDAKPYYFKDNTVANNIIYARDWVSWQGLPWDLGLQMQKNNLCSGPTLVSGTDAPKEVLSTRNTAPFLSEDTHWWDVMAPTLPELFDEGELGEAKEINRVNFSVSEDFVGAVIKESGLSAAEYKDVYKNLGAIPPGTKWKFSRPGPRWSVGKSALFHAPLPPSLDPWWVGFSDKPSTARTVKIRPWLGCKFYRDVGSLAYGAKVTASGWLTGKDADALRKWRQQKDFGPGQVVDGDPGTTWAWGSKTGGTVWLEIDLGKVMSFNFVELAKVHKCNKVDVQVKRGEKWQAIHSFKIDTYKTATYSARVPLTKARYVKIAVKTDHPGLMSEVRLLRLP
jgi:hypothetical protein